MASTITIVNQPGDANVNLNSWRDDTASATFNSFATAVSSVGNLDVPVTYQWQKSTNGGSSWSNIGGATGNILTVDVNVGNTTEQYRVRVSALDASPATVNSNAAVLTVTNQFADYSTATEAGSARYGRLWASEVV